MDYDVAVVGGGPGGYVAAIRAAQLGAKVLLIEKEELGGVCLNRGCIPTKTLLKSAEKWRDLQSLQEFGLQADHIGFDFNRVAGRMKQVVEQIKKGIFQLIKSNKIDIRSGTAKLMASNQISVSNNDAEKQYSARKIILATGSAPMSVPIPGADLDRVIDSNQLLAMTEVPKSLVVIGAGAVGIELAAIFQSFGCEVTVVEMQPRILPNIDEEIVKRMALVYRKQGIKFLTNSRVMSLREDGCEVVVTITKGTDSQEIAAEKVLLASGRSPVVEGLGLDEVGIEYNYKGIKVNNKMETSVAGIYAIGDVTGQVMWAHAASAAGGVAAENAVGGNVTIDYKAMPGCIYTTPECAVVGLTEREALEAGKEIQIDKFNFAANGKAVSLGETDGLVKIIADKITGHVLGMHIFGPHASDLIMEGALAIQNKLSVKEIGHTIHPHPSLSEAVMECALGIYGESVHQVKRRCSHES
ncbi:dihydrolipoamide dehydrogenase [Sporomusaceae bacterium BoRhaA]|uniref:dihydrolipoyl dehydrogenase n=1 Tax=Pelorhabdus rhamnosifermentans TaxID=2772457 RepID=UPI001C06441B|nr:dihydrolipoyl dehydrogenase [Pelorhabdus rhamnosifermentans]MBU2703063.1 dihydrolipoamide dehydrogenase [Pelorhabdus rhamnosifermentans]